MAISTTQVLQLGNFLELDNIESTTGADRASEMIGKTFGSADAALWKTRTSMRMNDGNNDSSIPFGNKTASSSEYITIGNPPSAPLAIDAGIRFNATVTYWDGTTATTVVRVLQDGTGNLYLLPPPRSAPSSEVLGVTQKPIQSLTINSISQNNYTALDTSRFGLPDDPSFPCFVAGTRIQTNAGETSVEDLRVGDLVQTLEGELRPIRWIGSRRLDRSVLGAKSEMRPIRISAGALGGGSPAQDLLVSPQHRMLIRSKIARRMFDADEVLVAAKHLCGIDGVSVADEVSEVEYFHLLFDKHEVIFANGAESESLYTGAEAIRSLGAEAQDEILALFPEFGSPDHAYAPARPLINGRQGKQLAARHARNHVPLRRMESEAASLR